MERILCALIAMAVMFSAATCFGGPFRNRGFQAQCENGVCAVPQQPTPAPEASRPAPQAEAHAHAQGTAKSVLTAPVRGGKWVAGKAVQGGKAVAKGVVKGGKAVGGKIVKAGKKVGKVILPPYGR